MEDGKIACATGYATQFAAVYHRVYGDVGDVASRVAVVDAAITSWRGLVRGAGDGDREEHCVCGVGCGGRGGAYRLLAGCDVEVIGEAGGSGTTPGVATGGGGVPAGRTDGAAGGNNGDACQASTLSSRGPNWERNRAWRAKRRAAKTSSVPVWRRGARGVASCVEAPSLSGSVNTVDTRTASEIEAADTLAQRRVVENKIAIAKGQHALASLSNKEKTEALARLDVVRVEERINTIRAKSQASYKKCGSPLESVGSAASAGEFAWKQQVRKQEALKAEVDSLGKQLDKLLTIATPAQFNMLARMELPHIPTDEEIAAMDEDCSPYYTREEAEAEAAAYGVF